MDNLDKLYVYYFTRNCEDEKVSALTHGFCLSVKDTELAIPAGDKASLVERDYMVPGTQRGPDSKLMPAFHGAQTSEALAVGRADLRIKSWGFYIPYIYGQAGWSVKGDVVKTRKN